MESDTMQATLRNVRQAQKDEDGLLTDVVSIFEQMKVLDHSRTARLEALAQKHSQKIKSLEARHQREIEQMKQKHKKEMEKKDRELRAALQGSRSSHRNSDLAEAFKDEIFEIRFVLETACEKQIASFDRLRTVQKRHKENYEKIKAHVSRLMFDLQDTEAQCYTNWVHKQQKIQVSLSILMKLAFDLHDLIEPKLQWTKNCIAHDTERDTAIRSNKALFRKRTQKLIDLVAAADISPGLTWGDLFPSERGSEARN